MSLFCTYPFINDISGNLMEFYRLVQTQSSLFRDYLLAYHQLTKALVAACDENYATILQFYRDLKWKREATELP